MAGALEDNWPPMPGAWLEDVAKQSRGAILEPLFEAWCAYDEGAAAAQLVDWVGESRVSLVAESWAREGLELVAVEASDRKVVLTAFRQLLDAARRAQDWESADRLAALARTRLSSKDWLQLGTEAVMAELQGAPDRHQSLPALVEELLGLGEAVADKADQRELTAAARQLIRALAPEATASLRRRLDKDAATGARA